MPWQAVVSECGVPVTQKLIPAWESLRHSAERIRGQARIYFILFYWSDEKYR
jgi:hypothetical protein